MGAHAREITVLFTHQSVEDVPLVHVNGNERLEFGSFDLGKVTSCLVNQRVQKLQESLVGAVHGFLVVARVLQRVSRVTCPDQLDAQKPDLKDPHKFIQNAQKPDLKVWENIK